MNLALRLLLAFGTLLATSNAIAASDIVYVGDSHSYGCFGQELDKELRAMKDPASDKNFVVRSTATCGSATWSWLEPKGHSTGCGYRACDTSNKCTKANSGKSKSLLDHLTEKPKVTVVALGSNMLKAPLDVVAVDVGRVIAQIKEAKSECIWIGPPQAAEFFMTVAKYDTFNTHLQQVVESKGCRFISSASKTARGNLNDTMGLHYDCKNGTAWAKKVFAEMKPMITDLTSSFSSTHPASKSGAVRP